MSSSRTFSLDHYLTYGAKFIDADWLNQGAFFFLKNEDTFNNK